MECVKLAKDFYVPIDNIKFYVAYKSNFVKRNVKNAKKEGRVFDVCSGRQIETVIYLKTGDIVITAIKTDTIHGRITANSDLNPAGR